MKVDRPSTPIISQKGFTIIELMIATLVFSVILLLVTYGLIQIGRTYIKGLNESKTQQTARSIMDTISQDIQFNGGTVRLSDRAAGTFAFCIGGNRYSVLTGAKLVDNAPATGEAKHVLVVDVAPIADCNEDPPTSQSLGGVITSESRELLGPNMRLASLAVCGPGATATFTGCPVLGSNLYQVNVRVVYGDNDLLNPARDACAGGAGSQFCAVAELSTTVQKRVR